VNRMCFAFFGADTVWGFAGSIDVLCSAEGTGVVSPCVARAASAEPGISAGPGMIWAEEFPHKNTSPAVNITQGKVFRNCLWLCLCFILVPEAIKHCLR
jgi:hypothetical protein